MYFRGPMAIGALLYPVILTMFISPLNFVSKHYMPRVMDNTHKKNIPKL